MSKVKTCPYCSAPIGNIRSDAKYCSPRCRLEAWRMVKEAEQSKWVKVKAKLKGWNGPVVEFNFYVAKSIDQPYFEKTVKKFSGSTDFPQDVVNYMIQFTSYEVRSCIINQDEQTKQVTFQNWRTA